MVWMLLTIIRGEALAKMEARFFRERRHYVKINLRAVVTSSPALFQPSVSTILEPPQ